MNRLSEDDGLRESLAKRAWLRALDFLPARQAKCVCSVYQTALRAHPRAIAMAR